MRMQTIEEAKKLDAVWKLHQETGVQCKNCEQFYHPRKTEDGFLIGDCTRCQDFRTWGEDYCKWFRFK